MKRAFTLIELLVVIGIIALLLAIILPGLRYAREMGRETVCRSNLRQMAIILATYTSANDNLFPDARYIYHSPESFDHRDGSEYPEPCRWHDERMGFDSPLLRENPELRGTLWPYLGNEELLRCQVGRQANDQRGCLNTASRGHRGMASNPVVCQYTYSMNAYLNSIIYTAGTGGDDLGVDNRTIREVAVRRTSQVTRNPATVFAFGEQNSWAVNTAGQQPIGGPYWSARYDLSRHVQQSFYTAIVVSQQPAGGESPSPAALDLHEDPAEDLTGTLRLPSLDIPPTHATQRNRLVQNDGVIGDAFATYHRPQGGDLNTGHSFVAMLDGHVEKVTVADQLRQSRRAPGLAESRLGPGGNLALAWPVDVPPLGGWENQ